MTFSTLQAAEADFGAEQTWLRGTYLDAYNSSAATVAEDITELWLTEAKDQLSLDMQQVLELDPTVTADSTERDELIDAHQPRMRRMLAVMQTVLVYRDMGGEPESFNQRQLRLYEREYAAMKQGLPGLYEKRGTQSVTTTRLMV